MDAQDALIDNIIMVANNQIDYDWSEVRRLAIEFINEIRKDIAIDKNPISYNGKL